MKMLHKLRIALAAAIVALAAVSAVDSASALLAGQADGFPNGRRLIDDVVDIELQAIHSIPPSQGRP
jgi:hypothetical protein